MADDAIAAIYPFQEFMNSRFVVRSRTAYVPQRRLRLHYRLWCEAHGLPRPALVNFDVSSPCGRCPVPDHRPVQNLVLYDVYPIVTLRGARRCWLTYPRTDSKRRGCYFVRGVDVTDCVIAPTEGIGEWRDDWDAVLALLAAPLDQNCARTVVSFLRFSMATYLF